MGAQAKFKGEWQIHFNAVMMHVRCGLFERAETIVK